MTAYASVFGAGRTEQQPRRLRSLFPWVLPRTEIFSLHEPLLGPQKKMETGGDACPTYLEELLTAPSNGETSPNAIRRHGTVPLCAFHEPVGIKSLPAGCRQHVRRRRSQVHGS